MEQVNDFVTRIQTARAELQQIRDLNSQLETQCGLQKKELEALQSQRSETQGELKGMMARVESLLKDKVALESKLSELKSEHLKLVSLSL